MKQSDPNNADLIKKVKKEIWFYFIDKMEANPWHYAIYHCGTEANIYSNVHWGYFSAGNQNRIEGNSKGKVKQERKPRLVKKMLIDGEKMLVISGQEVPKTRKR
jgi:hypothetical protein